MGRDDGYPSHGGCLAHERYATVYCVLDLNMIAQKEAENGSGEAP
jgi:hypothetical protein